MRQLGYDEVFIDAIGNVVGVLRGSGDGVNLMFNSHIDHVDPGNEALWQYPPFGGVVAGGYLHGRAASDVKGGLATQIYAGALLRQAGIPTIGYSPMEEQYAHTPSESPADIRPNPRLPDRQIRRERFYHGNTA